MKLAFRTYGEGRPLIILHGLFGQSDNWNTLAKQFAEKDLKVFTLDQRNHGLSGHSDEWTFEDMAEDLKEFIEDHHLEKPILMGHSMGAKTIMFFEKLYPGIASALVIVDMAAREYRSTHEDVLKALNSVDFNKIHNRKEVEAGLNRHLQDFGTKQFLLKNVYRKEGESQSMDWRFNLKTITEKYDNVSEAVPFYSSHIPTLIVKGERSDYIHEHDQVEFRSRFPESRFETIEGAAHWVHAEKPKEFFEAVMKFITALVP